MTADKTAIYKAQVNTPYGEFEVAVESTSHDAKSDIRTAAISEFNVHIAQVTVGDVNKSNRKILVNMHPIKRARTGDQYWAWIK